MSALFVSVLVGCVGRHGGLAAHQPGSGATQVGGTSEPGRAPSNVDPQAEGITRMTEVTAHHGLFKDTHLHVDDTGGPGRPVVLIHG